MMHRRLFFFSFHTVLKALLCLYIGTVISTSHIWAMEPELPEGIHKQGGKGSVIQIEELKIQKQLKSFVTTNTKYSIKKTTSGDANIGAKKKTANCGTMLQEGCKKGWDKFKNGFNSFGKKVSSLFKKNKVAPRNAQEELNASPKTPEKRRESTESGAPKKSYQLLSGKNDNSPESEPNSAHSQHPLNQSMRHSPDNIVKNPVSQNETLRIEAEHSQIGSSQKSISEYNLILSDQAGISNRLNPHLLDIKLSRSPVRSEGRVNKAQAHMLNRPSANRVRAHSARNSVRGPRFSNLSIHLQQNPDSAPSNDDSSNLSSSNPVNSGSRAIIHSRSEQKVQGQSGRQSSQSSQQQDVILGDNQQPPQLKIELPNNCAIKSPLNIPLYSSSGGYGSGYTSASTRSSSGSGSGSSYSGSGGGSGGPSKTEKTTISSATLETQVTKKHQVEELVERLWALQKDPHKITKTNISLEECIQKTIKDIHLFYASETPTPQSCIIKNPEETFATNEKINKQNEFFKDMNVLFKIIDPKHKDFSPINQPLVLKAGEKENFVKQLNDLVQATSPKTIMPALETKQPSTSPVSISRAKSAPKRRATKRSSRRKTQKRRSSPTAKRLSSRKKRAPKATRHR